MTSLSQTCHLYSPSPYIILVFPPLVSGSSEGDAFYLRGRSSRLLKALAEDLSTATALLAYSQDSFAKLEDLKTNIF